MDGRAEARWRRVPGVILVLAALLAAEVALRLARFGPTRAALGAWRAAPPWERLRALGAAGEVRPLPGADAAWAIAPGAPVVRYHLNSLGLRADGEVVPPPAGTCRLLAIGDAYTFGYGVAARDAYPQQLERRLGRHAAVEVLNAGFPNLDVEQQARRLHDLVPRLTPRVVLLSFSWWNVPLGDRETARPAKWSPAWLVANAEEKGARVGSQLAVADEVVTVVRRLSTPALLPPSGLARELEPLTLPPEALAARWARTRTALAAMAAEAAAAGARFAVVVTPLDLQVDPGRNRLYRSGRLPYPAHGFADVDYARATAMPEALARFAAAAGMPLVDTTPAFRAHRRARLFLDDDYHAAAAGHRLIAREVARWVEAAGACD